MEINEDCIVICPPKETEIRQTNGSEQLMNALRKLFRRMYDELQIANKENKIALNKILIAGGRDGFVSLLSYEK